MSARFLLPLCCLLVVLPASADPRDPWEGFNRGVFTFNDYADRWLLKPVAQGYQWITPDVVDTSVSHFFANLGEVVNAVNFTLQGEPGHGATAVGRLLVNSTLGVAGLFDVASAGGLQRRETDFGITLGKWGSGSGPYLVLPLLGPSTVRDAVAVPVDWVIDPVDTPLTVVSDERARVGLNTLSVIDRRADLLRYEQVITGDRYAFIRDVFLQRRDYDVHGAPPASADPFLDESFGEDDAWDDGDAGGFAPEPSPDTPGE